MPLQSPGQINAQKNTWGGFQTATIYSGGAAPSVLACPNAVAAGADILLFSGGGRLDSFTPILSTLHSGAILSVTFYDAGQVSSGGPFAASGVKILWASPNFVAPLSGIGGALTSGQYPLISLGPPITIGTPFQSGLCVATKSGQGGFTVGWTPETARQ